MKIGVISDTHATSFAQLPNQILHTLVGVDLIIHTGDFVARDILDGLKRLGEVKAVQGNMDSAELKHILPEKELLEIPAGGIDAGEDAEAAVIREMQEETGFRPLKLKLLCGFYSTPGYSTEYLSLYLATDLVPGRLHAEDTVGIEVVRVPVAQITEMVTSGEICDSKTLAGLLYFMEYRKTV